MTIEQTLMTCGAKLYLPLDTERHSFAAREANDFQIRLFQTPGLQERVTQMEILNGYINVDLDLWRVFLEEGISMELIKILQSEDLYKAAVLRAQYLTHLLPEGQSKHERLCAKGRRLLQMLLLPTLYRQKNQEWCGCFLEWSLSGSIRRMPPEEQYQMREIAKGITSAQKWA